MEGALACGIKDDPQKILWEWDLCLLLQIFHARGVREGGIYTWRCGVAVDPQDMAEIDAISNREVKWLSEQL